MTVKAYDADQAAAPVNENSAVSSRTLTVDTDTIIKEFKETDMYDSTYIAMLNFPTSEGKQPFLCMRIDLLPTFLLTLDRSHIQDETVHKKILHFIDLSRIRIAEHLGLASPEDRKKLREIGQSSWNEHFQSQFPSTDG